jgi:hypothetical protein
MSFPDFTSIIDTEQTITRKITLADAGDDRFDIKAGYRSGTFRPLEITLHYRVNRGSSAPYWYCFNVKIRAAKVLKSGELSTAYSNIIRESYYPERLPEWAREIAAMLLPVVEIERSPAGV